MPSRSSRAISSWPQWAAVSSISLRKITGCCYRPYLVGTTTGNLTGLLPGRAAGVRAAATQPTGHIGRAASALSLVLRVLAGAR